MAKKATDKKQRVRWPFPCATLQQALAISDVKGYGFIAADDGTEVFVHQSVVVASGGQSLLTGQRIKFTAVKQPRGFKAIAIMYD